MNSDSHKDKCTMYVCVDIVPICFSLDGDDMLCGIAEHLALVYPGEGFGSGV